MRGRKTPVAIRRVQGDTANRGSRKHEEALAGAWEARRGRPEMPEVLRTRKGDTAQVKARLAIARKHWEYLADVLQGEGLLSELDGGMLTQAAQTFALMNEAFRTGEYKAHEAAARRYQAAGDRLGLHEIARAKLSERAPRTEGDMIAEIMCA